LQKRPEGARKKCDARLVPVLLGKAELLEEKAHRRVKNPITLRFHGNLDKLAIWDLNPKYYWWIHITQPVASARSSRL
jgi:hypothetical protein